MTMVHEHREGSGADIPERRVTVMVNGRKRVVECETRLLLSRFAAPGTSRSRSTGAPSTWSRAWPVAVNGIR